jgi:hypothetical protein
MRSWSLIILIMAIRLKRLGWILIQTPMGEFKV